jgi:hypothetical protein
MKILLLLFVLLSSSMTQVPEEFVSRHQCVPRTDVSCVVDSYYICPPGYLDGCLTGETKHHKCVLQDEGPACELEITLNCPENFQDGCQTGETRTHTCVPVMGELCVASSALNCPIGFEDSCLQ